VILNKAIEQWCNEFPGVRDLIDYKETFWLNSNQSAAETVLPDLILSEDDILDAEARLKRFAPFIAHAFPETAVQAGIIESPLTRLSHIQTGLKNLFGKEIVVNPKS